MRYGTACTMSALTRGETRTATVWTAGQAPIAFAGAGSAESLAATDPFPLVEDFLAAARACGAGSRLADQGSKIEVEPHLLLSKHDFGGKPPVGIEICPPAIGSLGSSLHGPGAQIRERKETDGPLAAHLAARIDKHSGDFAFVGQAHGASPHGAAGGGANSIGEAAIRLHYGEDALVRLRQQTRKDLRGEQAHAYAQHLARAQMLMRPGSLLKQAIELDRWGGSGHRLCPYPNAIPSGKAGWHNPHQACHGPLRGPWQACAATRNFGLEARFLELGLRPVY